MKDIFNNIHCVHTYGKKAWISGIILLLVLTIITVVAGMKEDSNAARKAVVNPPAEQEGII